MAVLSKNDLKQESNNVYVNNNFGAITPDQVRQFNDDLVDSLATQVEVTAVSSSLNNVSSSFAAVSASVSILDSQEVIIASQTASMVVASASYSGYAVTASYALNGGGSQIDSSSLVGTASFNTYTASQGAKGYATTGSNTFDGASNIFTNDIAVLGTASINYLNATIVSQSIIFASGSNTFGDSLNDVQQLTGSVGVKGTLTVYGEAFISGTFSGSFHGTASNAVSSSYTLSSSYAVTASYVNLENDTLSIGNKTGVLKGGIISLAAGNTVDISAGTGQVISQSYEGPNVIKTSKVVAAWSTVTSVALQYKATHPVTYIYADKVGDIYQQTGSFSNEDFRTKIVLGAVTHADNEFIDSITDLKVTAFNSYKADENANIYGPLKTSGLQIIPIEGTNKVTINSGSVYYNGGNFGTDPWNANTQNVALIPTASFTRIWQSGSSYQVDNDSDIIVGPRFYTELDPNHYVNLTTGQLVTASVGKYTVQRIYQHYDNPDKLFVYYGSQEYPFIDDAINAIAFEKFEESDATKSGVFLGYVVIKQGTTDLSSAINGVVIYSGIGRHIFLSTGTNIGAIEAPLTAITFAFGTPSVSWSLNHNLLVDYPTIQCYSSESREIVIPDRIVSINANQTDVYFDQAFAGNVTVMGAGAQIAQGAFYGMNSASFYAWTGSNTSQFEGTASFAKTASYVQTAQTASFVNLLTQSVTISGRLAQGDGAVAGGLFSHAEGRWTSASQAYSHAEGIRTVAAGLYSHAEGEETRAGGQASHTEGYGTSASGSHQHVQGAFNIPSTSPFAFIIGNGGTAATRSNLVFASGSRVEVSGSLAVSGGFLVVSSGSTAPVAGAIIFDGTNFKGYNGSAWVVLG